MKRAANNSTNKKVTRRTKKEFPRMNDPIRIVPLHLPSELYRAAAGVAAPPAAQLTYRGGPLLSSAKVFTIFRGQAWHGLSPITRFLWLCMHRSPPVAVEPE